MRGSRPTILDVRFCRGAHVDPLSDGFPVVLVCPLTRPGQRDRRGQAARRANGVDQLLRYLELPGRDPPLAPVRGVFAAAEMRPQARVPAEDRGARCVRVDCESMCGIGNGALRLL